MNLTAAAALLACAPLLCAQEPPAKPAASPALKFETARIAKVDLTGRNQFVRFGGVHGGRYEAATATMLDLIRTAYGYQPDKVVGGPNWLEKTRYNIAAKVSGEASPDDLKLMLQSLLADRFALKVTKKDEPLPTFALTAGKSNKMKEGDNSGDSGCRPQASAPGPSGSGGGVMMFSTAVNGQSTTLRIGSDGMVGYTCRNVTMEAFVSGMRTMFGTNLGNNPILNETALKGTWTFDISYSINIIFPFAGGDQGNHVSFATAVEKQLGLKLDKREVPTPVIVVDSVNESPSPDPPGAAEALPDLVLPTEFDVASVTLSEPLTPGGRGGPIRFGLQPGGRYESKGLPLRFLIDRAFNSLNREEIQNVPDFAQSLRVDITAKVTLPPAADPNDQDLQAVLLRNLLADRFKMKYHTEERPVTAYQLVAGKPKLKKADPASRSHCTQSAAPAGSPPGTRVLTCQNSTLADFARYLQVPELTWPVNDATGIEGNYDLSVSFVAQAPALAALAAARAQTAGAGAAPLAATRPIPPAATISSKPSRRNSVSNSKR